MIEKLTKIISQKATELDNLMNGGRYHESDYIRLNKDINSLNRVISILKDENVN